MDMKPKEHTDNKTLREIPRDIPIFEDTVVSYGLMNDLTHSKYFTKAFESYFFKFTNDFLPAYGGLTETQHDRFKVMFEYAISRKSPDEFMDAILKPFENPDRYRALFQNAFLYAMACTYKSQIAKTYMRPGARAVMLDSLTEKQKLERMVTGQVNGSYLYGHKNFVAHHTDGEYVEYMIAAHPMLATFVKSKNRLQYKKILSVLGYLINPNLGRD